MFDRSRRRLAYWFTLSMGSILILFAFTVYQRQVREQMREFDARVYAQTRKIATLTSYQQQESGWLIDTENVSLQNRDLPLETKIIYLRWYDARKRLVEYIGDYPQQKSSIVPGWQTVKYDCDRHRQHQEQKLRLLTLPLQYESSIVGYLQIAVALEPIGDSLGRSRLFLSIGVPVTLGFTGIVGWILGGLAMQPVRRSYEQLQRFTADASHELRAPVSAILSNAQVGLLAPLGNSEQPRQRLENIVTQSKHMSALIANLLFLARHQGRLNPQDLTKIDIVDLLSSLAKEYEYLAVNKSLKFYSDLPTVSLEIRGDRDLLQQAIRNLLDNAIKYTPDGEGTVKLGLAIEPRRVLITISDSGIGIPAADLPHIFDRFYRVDKTRTRQTGGFGLGLAIAQQIVLAHQGKIVVESELGKGTSFQICLLL